jgi:hypothetical protein
VPDKLNSALAICCKEGVDVVESLGTEDGSMDRLARALLRFKAIEQTIPVTHNEPFAEKAEHMIRLEEEADKSKVSVEK